VALNARALDQEMLETTLSVLLKHESDLQRVKSEMDRPRTGLGPGQPRSDRPRWEDDDLGRSRRLN
jgi:hypothetical protein